MDIQQTTLENSAIQVLSTLDEANAAWQKIEPKIPKQNLDYYFYPDYIWLNELAEQNSKAIVLYLCSDSGFAWYPVIIRPLPEQFGLTQFDATSPYGFAGPLIIAANPDDRSILLSQLGQAWQNYCQQNGIIAEFCRFHPLLENNLGVSWLEAHQVKDVVYFDLTVTVETLPERLHSQKRRSLKKADKSNLVFSTEWKHYDAFKALYQASMEQKNADSFYHFSSPFFDRIEEIALRHPDNIKLHSVLRDDTVISSGIFFAAGDIVEYFLGANAPEARNVHSSAWMLWETALTSKAEGYAKYVLGGGVKADDELFRFKQQLSPLTAPYSIGRKVVDAEAYEQLKLTYQQGLAQTGNVPDLANAPIFFYRSAG